MAQPLITVVMTVYQRPDLALRALYSVVHQTYKNWELLVYMDGPHHELVTVIREYALHMACQDRVRIVTHACPRGTYGNPLRRMGLAEARGAYVLFMGHDCLLNHNCLDVHVNSLPEDADHVISCARLDHWVKREFGTPDNELVLERHVGVVPGLTFSSALLTIGDIDLTCVLFPTAIARAHGVFREAWDSIYAADFLSIAVCAAVSPLVYSPVIVGAHF